MNCTRRAIMQVSAATALLVTHPHAFLSVRAGNTDVNLYTSMTIWAPTVSLMIIHWVSTAKVRSCVKQMSGDLIARTTRRTYHERRYVRS